MQNDSIHENLGYRLAQAAHWSARRPRSAVIGGAARQSQLPSSSPVGSALAGGKESPSLVTWRVRWLSEQLCDDDDDVGVGTKFSLTV